MTIDRIIIIAGDESETNDECPVEATSLSDSKSE